MTLRQLRSWLLLVSLAGNGFLGGVLLAGRPQHPLPPPPGPHDVVERMASVLSGQDALILRQVAAAQGMTEPPPPDDFADFHRRSAELMAAEDFDAQAFARLVAEFSAKREQAGNRVGKLLVETLPRLSVAGRRALASLPPPGPAAPPPKPPARQLH